MLTGRKAECSDVFALPAPQPGRAPQSHQWGALAGPDGGGHAQHRLGREAPAPSWDPPPDPVCLPGCGSGIPPSCPRLDGSVAPSLERPPRVSTWRAILQLCLIYLLTPELGARESTAPH